VDDVLLTATRQSGGTDRGSRRSSLSSRAQRGISAVKHATTELLLLSYGFHGFRGKTSEPLSPLTARIRSLEFLERGVGKEQIPRFARDDIVVASLGMTLWSVRSG
jgi:hypothetical protein